MEKITFSENLHILRKNKGLSQDELASALGLKRSTLADYEKGKTQPTFSTVYNISEYFNIDTQELLFGKVTDVHLNEKSDFPKKSAKSTPISTPNSTPNRPFSEKLQVNETKVAYQMMPKTITVDSSGKENILLVPVKARAGYLLGYGDAEYLRTLPAFTLPGYNNGTYRMFEVQGQSMFNTFNDGDRCIARWAGISEIKDGRVYVLITTDGILVKRCLNRLESGVIIAKSDNNYGGEYPNQVIQAEDIKEVWYVVEKLTRHLPEPGEIYKRLHQLEGDVTILKEQLKAR